MYSSILEVTTYQAESIDVDIYFLVYSRIHPMTSINLPFPLIIDLTLCLDNSSKPFFSKTRWLAPFSEYAPIKIRQTFIRGIAQS